MGEERVAPGGVLHHGTYEEDGPVTWEALVSPREFPVLRRAGDPSPKPVRLAGARAGRRGNRQKKRLPQEVGRWRGEPEPRPKEARESEGRIRALTSGNLLATRTRPSKGGPC